MCKPANLERVGEAQPRRGYFRAEPCPECGGKLKARNLNDRGQGQFGWRCMGRCGQLWNDDLSDKRPGRTGNRALL